MQQQQTSKWYRLWRLLRLVPRAIKFRLMQDQVGLYSCICDEFLNLGGIYVKFLQGVLLQSDAMKNWEGANKFKIFEAVPIVDMDVIKILTGEFRKQPAEIFSHLDIAPFATGSFGQVYQARLHSGEDVVIKILRPHIRKILKFDLRLLSVIAKLFTGDFTSLDVSLGRAVRDFKVMTYREVDYISEVSFAEEMYEVFKDDSSIFIPKTYRELCTEQVIVQQFVPGVSVAEILKAMKIHGADPVEETFRLTGSDLKLQLTNLASQVLFNFFKFPRMPGDLHPGNVKLLPGNIVGIVDFGISARQAKVPNIFYTLLKQLTHVNEDGTSAGQMFVTYIKYFAYDLYLAFDRVSRQYSEKQTLTDFICNYAQDIFDKQTGGSFQIADIQHATMFGAFVNKTVNENNKFAIVTRVSEVELLRAVQTLVALIDSLELRELIGVIFKQVYERVTTELPHFTREPTNPLSLHESLSIIDSWLSRLALKNPELFLKLKFFLNSQQKPSGS